ncbi:hypothetical protein Pfo_020253 [Paulownia fortunei]|nr:hypothetical protein Pfo_020253 [Paulownia fortunei]
MVFEKVCTRAWSYLLILYKFWLAKGFLVTFVFISESLQQEKQKAMVNEMIGKLTAACWDKCITGTPGSKFSSSESTCLTNCAQRYMDMSLLIMKRLQQ